MLSNLEAILIGILQGILEWLPVSSEGTLVLIINQVFGLDPFDAFVYSIFLHIGTGTAALLYFRKDVLEIILARNQQCKKLRREIFIITILTGLVGFPIYMFLEISSKLGETLIAILGVALIISGLIQKNIQESGLRKSYSLTLIETIVIGIIQGFAIIPGISRSGITISALLFMKYRGKTAFKLSFLMSIPVSYAATFGMYIIEKPSIESKLFISLIISLIIGYLTIDSMLKLANRINSWKIVIGMGLIALFSYISILL
jgi:undecaprenyl-diphosphatase